MRQRCDLQKRAHGDAEPYPFIKAIARCVRSLQIAQQQPAAQSLRLSRWRLCLLIGMALN